jgi:hypothetical protein
VRDKTPLGEKTGRGPAAIPRTGPRWAGGSRPGSGHLGRLSARTEAAFPLSPYEPGMRPTINAE